MTGAIPHLSRRSAGAHHPFARGSSVPKQHHLVRDPWRDTALVSMTLAHVLSYAARAPRDRLVSRCLPNDVTLFEPEEDEVACCDPRSWPEGGVSRRSLAQVSESSALLSLLIGRILARCYALGVSPSSRPEHLDSVGRCCQRFSECYPATRDDLALHFRRKPERPRI